jgi:hypothetical protein
MIRKHLVSLVTLLILAALWADTRLNGFSLTQPTQAQATKPSEARKWDFCTIVCGWDSKRNSPTATIGFITPTGRRFEPLQGGASPESLSVAFAKLGSEGWEFVGQVMFNPAGEYCRPDTWLFKRPVL